MEQLSGQRGLDVPNVEPRVTIQVPSAGEVSLVVRIPAKSAQRSHLEQAIIADVLGVTASATEPPEDPGAEPV